MWCCLYITTANRFKLIHWWDSLSLNNINWIFTLYKRVFVTYYTELKSFSINFFFFCSSITFFCLFCCVFITFLVCGKFPSFLFFFFLLCFPVSNQANAFEMYQLTLNKQKKELNNNMSLLSVCFFFFFFFDSFSRTYFFFLHSSCVSPFCVCDSHKSKTSWPFFLSLVRSQAIFILISERMCNKRK